MKVLLFDPPYERFMGIKTTSLYPIGLAYLTATLRKAGHQATYVNFDFDNSAPLVNLLSREADIKNYQCYNLDTL